jgi:hypothetical protein
MENNVVFNSSYGSTSFNSTIINMVAEAGENFLHYLKRMGLSKESDLIVLSSKHHYYYDENELKSVRTLINLKKLNLIKHLDAFLFTLIHVLPQNANFIGCFSDSKTVKANSFSYYRPSRLFNRFINLLDSSTDNSMNKDEVTEILERNGFKVVDMTEINGLTYFCSQNTPTAAELRASLKALINKN